MESKKPEIKENDFSIYFGNKEGDSRDGHNNISAQLNLSTLLSVPIATIIFDIEKGFPVGHFDYERKSVRKGLSLEEAEKLKNKLDTFIKEGRKFLRKYK